MKVTILFVVLAIVSLLVIGAHVMTVDAVSQQQSPYQEGNIFLESSEGHCKTILLSTELSSAACEHE